MSISAVLNKIIGRQAARKVERLQSYDELVRAVHAGTEPSEDEIETILESAGRTCDDLTRDVQLAIDRHAWAAQLATEPAFRAEHDKLYGEQIRADDEFNESMRRLRDEYSQRATAIQQRLVTVDAEIDRCQTARNRLTRSSLVHARLAELWTEHGATMIELQSLPAQLRSARPADVGFFENEITRVQAAADQLAAEIAQLEREALQP